MSLVIEGNPLRLLDTFLTKLSNFSNSMSLSCSSSSSVMGIIFLVFFKEKEGKKETPLY
jgi:hypothetical protein